MTQRYKLRAEGAPDVVQFIMKAHNHLINFKLDNIKGIPDVVFEFETSLSLDRIIELLEYINDSHVMVQTVATIENYTGER